MDAREVNRILEEIAPDTRRLGMRLSVLEIKGRRHSEDQTPLGIFLQEAIPGSIVRVGKRREQVTISLRGVTYSRPLPEQLRQFMQLFDAGVLPSLEKGLPSRFPTLFFQLRRLRLSPLRQHSD